MKHFYSCHTYIISETDRSKHQIDNIFNISDTKYEQLTLNQIV